jgi:hypothetical protein
VAARVARGKNRRMWVDVVCLRRDGAKLSADELRGIAPLRARLTMDTVVVPSAEPPRRADVAQLWPERGSPIGVLECARVSRVGGAGLLVVGVEAAEGTPGHPQAWWCRVLLAADDGSVPDTVPGAGWRDTWPASLPAPLTDAVSGGTARPAA